MNANQKSFDAKTHTLGVTFSLISKDKDSEKFHFESYPKRLFHVGVPNLMFSSLAETTEIKERRLASFNGYLRTSVAGNDPEISKAAEAVRVMNAINRRLVREGFDECSSNFCQKMDAFLRAAKVDLVWFEEYSKKSQKDSFTFYQLDELEMLFGKAVEMLIEG